MAIAGASIAWLHLAAGEPSPATPDSLNVKDYGAKGDGVSNDYAALSKAFSAAATTGTTVYLPAGTYLVNSRLTVPANVSVIGDGSSRGSRVRWSSAARTRSPT